MLPLTIQSTNEISSLVKSMMDRGMLHRHLQESSTLDEMTLSVVPYWLVNVSARTSIVATNMVAESATVATTAALIGVMAGMGGGRRGGFGAPFARGGYAGFNDGQRHWRRGWTEERDSDGSELQLSHHRSQSSHTVSTPRLPIRDRG